MALTSEPAIGLAVMQVLANEPKGEATVRTLVKKVPNYVKLTNGDREPSPTRPGEEVWEQRVRNLKSHHEAEGNVIAEGFVEHIGWGRYRLTEAGHRHLVHKGLVQE
ncbi:hypothetical protein [Hoeflea sp. TYP-13]|uniref:hypothetical protein n=1 Tax=Hoeflea sp. TYP-13 TaxID=3230023 RepID=UPI0034C5D28B